MLHSRDFDFFSSLSRLRLCDYSDILINRVVAGNARYQLVFAGCFPSPLLAIRRRMEKHAKNFGTRNWKLIKGVEVDYNAARTKP